MGATGLLTQRCDPFGAESKISLLGGMYPENHVGRIMWHCAKAADARYRMTCTGGAYGERVTADGGLIAAYHCDGGHRGQVMPLCTPHRRMLAKRQAGVCPACMWPPAARELHHAIERAQVDMRNAAALGYYVAAAKLGDTSADLQGQMDELIAQGLVHKCPLRLEEVS